ncbi:RagB/SusD family nutrient uptake outer membrane protein [Chitinophaga nivalis]|uniref:RagB/SusD family nutrient uptake outer membrane protein n=1 Tax=Chitinophaga nivalis TaxID=2991709 RepID=A0ABT3IUB8_9BACT|nr:RagB/SusD family nutrient uptake outer membrane protein [Chitinophaga nivalis]MCW3462722.1 RagB/SusD family nutrient uptake outer membrane protein [Chitinophaga nivalis]MCW3487587.1 RagB/SusD family nutrient uptake outer membrane protein [Chitinophaga nivalis]
MRNTFAYKYNRGMRTATAALLAITLGTASCSKFTELAPKNAYPSESVFKDPATIELAVNGMYSTAAIGSYNDDYTVGRGYPFGSAAIEQDEMRGEDMINLQAFYEFTYKATYSPTSANNVQMWVNLYALINQANTLIDGVRTAAKNGVITEAKAGQIEGEARFLRALAHHEALIHYSRPYADGAGSQVGVPYRDLPVSTPEQIQAAMKIGRGTVKEDYTKMLADLDYAETHMAASAPAFTIAKATKGAAIALKTRIKLHMGDWKGVIDEATKLGADQGGTFVSPVQGFKLTESPDGPFLKADQNTESIFSIANNAVTNPGTNGALASMFGPAELKGRGLVATSPALFNATFWAADDLRREKLQFKQTLKVDGKPSQNYYFNYKYRDYLNKSDWAPVIRYAEVLLNAAEAYARLGNNAQSFKLFSAVRNRSLLPTSPNIITAPPADMIQAVLNERRVEFAGEGRRWPDIHRLALDAQYGTSGIPAKILPTELKADGSNYNAVTRPVTEAKYSGFAYSHYRFLWPLPATEIASNPTLKNAQNPNY